MGNNKSSQAPREILNKPYGIGYGISKSDETMVRFVHAFLLVEIIANNK